MSALGQTACLADCFFCVSLMRKVLSVRRYLASYPGGLTWPLGQEQGWFRA